MEDNRVEDGKIEKNNGEKKGLGWIERENKNEWRKSADDKETGSMMDSERVVGEIERDTQKEGERQSG